MSCIPGSWWRSSPTVEKLFHQQHFMRYCEISFNLINKGDALECEIGTAWFDSNLSGSGRWRNELRLKQFEKYFTLWWTNCRWRRRRKDKNRKIMQGLMTTRPSILCVTPRMTFRTCLTQTEDMHKPYGLYVRVVLDSNWWNWINKGQY